MRPLIDALFQWLEQERASLLASWYEKGVAPVRKIQRFVGERKCERPSDRSMALSVNFKQQEVEVSQFRLAPNTPMLYRFESEPPGSLLLNNYGEVYLERALPKSKPDETLSMRLAHFFGSMCAAYLSSLRSLVDGERHTAESIAIEYLDYLERDSVFEVTQVALGGITPPSAPLTSSDLRVSIRALTAEELGEVSRGGWGVMTFNTNVLPASMPLLQLHEISMEGCMLIVRTARRKDDDRHQTFEAGRLLVALELLRYAVNGRAISGAWSEPGPRTLVLPRLPELPLFPTGPESDILAEDLDRASALSLLIPETAIEKPRTRADFVIRRFIAASAHEDEAEAIFDYVIALEALLVPDAHTEVSYRVSVHGARYLATDTLSRQEVLRDLKTLYGIRSRLAHGSGPDAKSDLHELRRKARDLAATGIIKALQSGWPSAADFTALSLS
jgi:hypothetical protein